MAELDQRAVVRILIVDDEPAMHDSYRRSFATADDAESSAKLEAMARDLFGTDGAAPADAPPRFDLAHVDHGEDAVRAVMTARDAAEPFAIVFLDVRMPPGIDGRETAVRIRSIDRDVAIVIVTGYSDHAPLDIARDAGPVDKLFYIAKPFDVAEIVQTATALGERWRLDRVLAATRADLARQVALLEDRTAELAANESRALHMAMHDSLTDAPNRLAFLRALGDRARQPGLFAIAMFDLDRFKLVNDTLGHLAGDRLIQLVYATLHGTAPEGALVARLGGDEFGILFDTPGEAAAVLACERVIAACGISFDVFGHSVKGGSSAGLKLAEEDGPRDPVDLLRRADLALNDAKRAGRGQVRVFDEEMDEGIRFRRRIEGGLSAAIARGELSLVYQPIVARDTMTIAGFEALLRWETPDYGRLSPDVFIPIAEESNLIHDLGDWVLAEALAELKAWPDQYVSINFSPRQFRRQNFVGHVMECVERAGVSPSRIQIEITELAIFNDAEQSAETLSRLRQLGFRIALDDFGTGYSSLYNIRTFALDCLKIDRSFIDGMGRERESAAIVHSIIHLGRALGLEVIGEGVETDAQVQALRIAGAASLQGYYFSLPVPGAQAREMARTGRIDAPGAVAEATGTLG